MHSSSSTVPVGTNRRARRSPPHPPDQELQRERLAAVGQVAAGVAHDFHNVVSAIGLYAELLQQQSLDEAGGAQLAAIRQQVEYGTSLVWQVLDSVHRREDEPVEVDLAPFLEALVSGLGRPASKGIVISVRESGTPFVVDADPTRLRQIFVNLATNAIDALDVGGTIDIVLSRGGTPTPWVRIDVADTGTGMPPDVAARAFDAFFTTKPPGEGTGLGLAQVRALTARLGGRVEIETSVGEGTTVSVWLRAAPPDAVDEANRAAGRARGLR